MLVFLWSESLRIYLGQERMIILCCLGATFSLENIAITLNQFKTKNYLAKRGYLNLSKSIIKPFLSSGLSKSDLSLYQHETDRKE